jgi:hypothetical protein
MSTHDSAARWLFGSEVVMWSPVRDNFLGFSEPLEGKVLWMYLDSLGLVSIGVGNLIDPFDLALALPSLGAPYFNKTSGEEGTTDEIRADWNGIKQAGAGWQAAESLTNLRIREEGCERLVLRKADEFESYLTSHVDAFTNMSNWPADAQLGLMSMAWAMGPAFADGNRWPTFRSACANEDWLEAAANCNMSNAWLTKRNAVNRGLFRNAAYAVAQDDFDPSILWLPIGVSRPNLNPGDTDSEDGAYVSEAQVFLSWLGYTTEQTGVFDDQTLDQVKAFQRDEGFPTTGTIGPLTWAALGYQVPSN